MRAPMGSKVISITEEVYKLLKSVQFPNESFGDTIKRLCNQRTAKNLVHLVKFEFDTDSIPDDIWESFENEVNKSRKRQLLRGELDIDLD